MSSSCQQVNKIRIPYKHLNQAEKYESKVKLIETPHRFANTVRIRKKIIQERKAAGLATQNSILEDFEA